MGLPTMDEKILQKIEELNQKINAVYISTEKTRKYFLWTLIISVVVIVLPLIGILFLLPTLLSNMTLPTGL
jgi:hypothetical protein